jgi:hypothetical protein
MLAGSATCYTVNYTIPIVSEDSVGISKGDMGPGVNGDGINSDKTVTGRTPPIDPPILKPKAARIISINCSVSIGANDLMRIYPRIDCEL